MITRKTKLLYINLVFYGFVPLLEAISLILQRIRYPDESTPLWQILSSIIIAMCILSLPLCGLLRRKSIDELPIIIEKAFFIGTLLILGLLIIIGISMATQYTGA